mgnify:CR=1 FL=1
MSIKESTVERHLRRRVKALGGVAIKIIPFYMPGLPDRLVVLPGGKYHWVELKRPGEEPRSHQVRVHKLLGGLGCSVVVLDSVEAVDIWLEETTRGDSTQ